jgi:ubiquinone biosynthesis protein UbiJ
VEASTRQRIEAGLKARLDVLPSGPGTIELRLSEEPDAPAWQVILGEEAQLLTGPAEWPSCSITVQAADLEDLWNGYAQLEACLIDGRVELEGDLALGMVVVPALLASD